MISVAGLKKIISTHQKPSNAVAVPFEQVSHRIPIVGAQLTTVNGFMMKVEVNGQHQTLCTHRSQPRLFKTPDSLIKEARNCGLETVTFHLHNKEPKEDLINRLMKSAKQEALSNPGNEVVIRLSNDEIFRVTYNEKSENFDCARSAKKIDL